MYATLFMLFSPRHNPTTLFGVLALTSRGFLCSPVLKANTADLPPDIVFKTNNLESSKASEKTGFEDLDYWQLELELAQEMVRLNKEQQFLDDSQELRDKLSIPHQSAWQSTESVADALTRSTIESNTAPATPPDHDITISSSRGAASSATMERPKRAASKSVEQRMLAAKYSRRDGGGGDLRPRWIRLVHEMKTRRAHRLPKYLRPARKIKSGEADDERTAHLM